jgi:outer membrane protein
MKKFLIAMSTVVLFVFGSTAFADLKIGVLDLNKIMMDSPQLAAAKVKLKSDFDKREKDILSAQQIFQKAVEDFNKNGPTMKADAQKNAQQDIVKQQKDLQDKQSKFQNDLNASQGAAMKDIVKKIEGIVNGIAADKKFDLILAKAGTAFNKPELEITDDVIKQMKK